jgi:hypothetical protein
MLKPGTPFLLKVRVQVEEAGTRLSLLEARRLQDVAEHSGSGEFRLRLDMTVLNEDALDRLEDLFAASPGPCQVVFELCNADGSIAVVQAQQRVKSTPEFVDAVRQICGEHAVAVAAA